MLKNIPISELLKVLNLLSKEATLCTIRIDEDRKVITFYAVKDPNAIKNEALIQVPKEPNVGLDIDDLDKLIV
jgi:hypothetical protein